MIDVGHPTYFTRVEAWECDHNQHWNVRNYMRAFQQAGFVVADMAGQRPGPVVTQHTRFHRELFHIAPVEVRSAVLSDGPFAGALVHLLLSDGRLSATALDQPGLGASVLPGVRSEEVKLALPRGIDGAPFSGGPTMPGADVIEHGLVQPREVDHTGSLGIDRIVRRIATAANKLIADLGFTPDVARAQKLSRMGVETKITRLAPIGVGTRICSTSTVAEVGRKNIVLRHRLFTPAGQDLAAIDQGLVFVDMEKRRATEVPEVLRGALG